MRVELPPVENHLTLVRFVFQAIKANQEREAPKTNATVLFCKDLVELKGGF